MTLDYQTYSRVQKTFQVNVINHFKHTILYQANISTNITVCILQLWFQHYQLREFFYTIISPHLCNPSLLESYTLKSSIGTIFHTRIRLRSLNIFHLFTILKLLRRELYQTLLFKHVLSFENLRFVYYLLCNWDLPGVFLNLSWTQVYFHTSSI